MAFRVRILIYSTLLFSSTINAQLQAQFWISRLKDFCEWEENTRISASNNTENGSLCGYVPVMNRVYACPAPDRTCWTYNQPCVENSTSPGPDQILCNAIGRSKPFQWCCHRSETCTNVPKQINACVASFVSPNDGISPEEARLKASRIVPPSEVVSVPTIEPSVFLNTTFLTNPPTTTRAQPAFTEVTRGSVKDHGTGISNKTLVGILIGAIVGTAILSALFVLFIVRRLRGSNGTDKDGDSSLHKSHSSQQPLQPLEVQAHLSSQNSISRVDKGVTPSTFPTDAVSQVGNPQTFHHETVHEAPGGSEIHEIYSHSRYEAPISPSKIRHEAPEVTTPYELRPPAKFLGEKDKT